MEGGRVSLLNCVPSFAQGTDILVVHSDTLCLGHLSSLLRQCSFKVTATNQASAAIDMVCQQEGRFKLVMAKANMPDMSTISFLNTLLLKHITVIFICSGQDDGGAKEAFDRGYCHLLQEPIQLEHLISLWQQVYNSNDSNLAQEIHSAKSKQKVHESSEEQDNTHNDVRVKKKGKRAHNSNQVKLDNNNNHHAAEMEGEETREHNDNNRFPQKKPRISWTSDLHDKFVQAISVMGENSIRPKLIQEIMNVPYLTCRHIASHLQKFKSEVRRRLQDKCKSSNFRDGTKSSSSIQSQCHPGYPTSAAFQNRFPVSFSGTEDLEAVVRGAVPDALMDKNQYDDFGNGFTEDDSSQNSEIQTNPIFRNSSCPQKSNSSKPWCAKPSAILRELEPCDSMNQSETLTEDKNILRILGGDSEGYDFFRRGPDLITQNSEIRSSCIHGYNTLDSYNPSSAFVGGHELTDQNNTLTEHDSVLRFVGEGDDCFGKGPCSQNSEMLRNSVLGYNFGQQMSVNYNPSCDRLLKSKVDALKNQNQNLTENNNIPRFLEEDCDIALNSKMLRNSVSGNSSSSQQSDAYSCLGNAPSSYDIVMLKSLTGASCQNCTWMDSGVHGDL